MGRVRPRKKRLTVARDEDVALVPPDGRRVPWADQRGTRDQLDGGAVEGGTEAGRLDPALGRDLERAEVKRTD